MAAANVEAVHSTRPAVRRRSLLALLVTVALGVTAVVAWRAPGGADGGAEYLTLAELAFAQEDYSGRRVRTGGVVQRFGPDDGALRLHYVIADEADHRVKLVGGDPARYVGQAVEVTGRFRMVQAAGRTIEVEHIEAR